MSQDNQGARRRIPRIEAQTIAIPVSWSEPLAWRWHAGRAWLQGNLAQEVEQRRLFPWLAAFFGLGIVLFFQSEQPSLWAPITGLALCGAGAVLARRHARVFAILIALSAVFAGFSAAAFRSRNVAAPVLARITIAPVTGFVAAVEDREEGKRLLLRISSLGSLPEPERPRLVRLSVRKGEGLAPGQFVSLTARLLPPPQPAWPGGYDFARDAYFKGIGAVGSVLGPIRSVDAPHAADVSLRLGALIDEARNALTQRIAGAIGGNAGGVAAALVTGKRGLIDEPTNDVLRAAGIYHIVSISGLHMVLAAGTFFWLVRALLALAPALALFWPVKKIAAVAAMAGGTAYCVFSGSDVATERSLIMTLVMFGAVLVDRPALSIRNLSLAAILVLAREPEALLGPSFQMSFSAVAAMMALVPLMQRQAEQGAPLGPVDRVLRWVKQTTMGLFTTTLVAGLATAPFAAYHFQTLTPYGLVGNALALPLVSLVVMPCAVLGVIAYPFGLDRPVWQLMGAAVEQVLQVSAWVGAFPGSTVVVPALGMGALALLSLALLVLAIPASALRWLAVVPAGAGLALAASPVRYDLFVDREGAGAAIRGRNGQFTLVGKPSGFVVEQWLRADGDARSADDPTLRQDARCDRLGCVVGTARRPVVFVQDEAAFDEDCRRAAIVVTRLAAPAGCEAPVVLDKAALAQRGASAVRMTEAGIELRSVRGATEIRPWLLPKPQNANRPRVARPVPEQDIPEEEISSGEPD